MIIRSSVLVLLCFFSLAICVVTLFLIGLAIQHHDRGDGDVDSMADLQEGWITLYPSDINPPIKKNLHFVRNQYQLLLLI